MPTISKTLAAKPDYVREGLRVSMYPIKGMTDAKLMPYPFWFQCPPTDEFARQHAYTHVDYDTATSGQFSRPGGRQLRTVSIDTLFADQGDFMLFEGVPRGVYVIEDAVDYLTLICEAGVPFKFIAEKGVREFPSRAHLPKRPDFYMNATLRTVKVTEKAGEGDALYVECEFHEYRNPTVAEVGAGKRAGGKSWPATVLLYKDGSAKDEQTKKKLAKPVTLTSLEKEYYSTRGQAAVIASKNGIKKWGRGTPLIEYSKYRHAKRYPVKITIPKPVVTSSETQGGGSISVDPGAGSVSGTISGSF